MMLQTHKISAPLSGLLTAATCIAIWGSGRENPMPRSRRFGNSSGTPRIHPRKQRHPVSSRSLRRRLCRRSGACEWPEESDRGLCGWEEREQGEERIRKEVCGPTNHANLHEWKDPINPDISPFSYYEHG